MPSNLPVGSRKYSGLSAGAQTLAFQNSSGSTFHFKFQDASGGYSDSSTNGNNVDSAYGDAVTFQQTGVIPGAYCARQTSHNSYYYLDPNDTDISAAGNFTVVIWARKNHSWSNAVEGAFFQFNNPVTGDEIRIAWNTSQQTVISFHDGTNWHWELWKKTSIFDVVGTDWFRLVIVFDKSETYTTVELNGVTLGASDRDSASATPLSSCGTWDSLTMELASYKPNHGFYGDLQELWGKDGTSYSPYVAP